jgi:type I restriction enzyme S subunit
MNQGRDITHTKETITALAFDECGCRLVAPGTVLLSFKLSIGKVGISRTGICTNEAIAALPIKNSDRISSEYLYWVLKSADLSNGQDRAAMGLTLNKPKLLQIAISVPPLPEQRRIAKILDAAEALRVKRRAALADIDALTQAIFLDLFGDPVVNRKAWPTAALGAVGTLDRGVSKHRPRNAPELLGGQHPLVQTGEVANCDGYIRIHNASYSDVGLKQSKMWPAGTLCITIAANIAKTGILSFDACFPDSVVGFRADDQATVEYVRIWLSFLQQTLEDNAPESAQKNINLKILRELEVPVPPLPLQQEFARRIAAVETLKSAHRAHLAELDALFASLQHRAFRGEL